MKNILLLLAVFWSGVVLASGDISDSFKKPPRPAAQTVPQKAALVHGEKRRIVSANKYYSDQPLCYVSWPACADNECTEYKPRSVIGFAKNPVTKKAWADDDSEMAAFGEKDTDCVWILDRDKGNGEIKFGDVISLKMGDKYLQGDMRYSNEPEAGTTKLSPAKGTWEKFFIVDPNDAKSTKSVTREAEVAFKTHEVDKTKKHRYLGISDDGKANVKSSNIGDWQRFIIK